MVVQRENVLIPKLTVFWDRGDHWCQARWNFTCEPGW